MKSLLTPVLIRPKSGQAHVLLSSILSVAAMGRLTEMPVQQIWLELTNGALVPVTKKGCPLGQPN
jgi:hypothetical protein